MTTLTLIESPSVPCPLYLYAPIWRSLVRRGVECVERFHQNCLVDINEDGMSGRVGAVSEAPLKEVKERAFGSRFHFSEIQFDDGLYWMGFRPRPLIATTKASEDLRPKHCK